MEFATLKNKPMFARGDKVVHRLSEDDNMIGTVTCMLEGNRCRVEFYIPGRKRGGYTTEIDFNISELEPCFVDIESTKRNTA